MKQLTENAMNYTIMKLRQLVRSGAIHPIVLVREALIKSALSHTLWHMEGDNYDFTKFPWPMGRTLWDLVAHVCNRPLMRIASSDKHYFKMLSQVEIVVFGKSNPERK